jgi:GTP pyrophosphokinase
MLDDLVAVASEGGSVRIGGDDSDRVDTVAISSAFAFACVHHGDQKRKSGDEFITHPVGVARICLELGVDTETVCAALLHDTVEDTSASLEEIEASFGGRIANLVDGVTKLTEVTFESRDERQAENYRKMIVAMASDIRVILIKLADRLHNMRTLGSLPKQKQIAKSRETLEIYAPLAHRLGIHKLKWELEDLAFATLHPRKYTEIKQLVGRQRAEREDLVERARDFLTAELEKNGIASDISGRPKHFYSIHKKMVTKDREFNEILDLTAMRVLVDSVKDCYGAIGVIHSLWKPLPGRFKDYVAMPKANLYQALHTTVAGIDGKPLEIQIRTRDMHRLAEYGIAAHVAYKEGSSQSADGGPMPWLTQLVEEGGDQDPSEFLESLKIDLFEDEVYVFTPKGEVKSLSAGATPLDFAYSIHTDVGHRCVGAKVNGTIVPLHYQLKSGDIVEVMTSKKERGPSRDWLTLVTTSRARNKIRAWFREESREDAERKGREALGRALKKADLPPQHFSGSPILADIMREMGFRKADDFYIALGQGKISSRTTATKLMQRLRSGEVMEPGPGAGVAGTERREKAREASDFGIVVGGQQNVSLRLAKCCRPVPGDGIVGYVSLGRGITVHREDCRNVGELSKTPERMVDVSWEGDNETTFRVEVQIDAYDRTRLLEDLSRSLAEAGVNIISASCMTNPPMVKNRFVVEVGDTGQLKQCISRLRQVESVFDVFRVTPGE